MMLMPNQVFALNIFQLFEILLQLTLTVYRSLFTL